MSENIPHSLGGFRGAFESEHGRKPTEQEIWNAAIRSWRDITRQKSDSAKELEEVIADLLMYAGDNGYSHIDYADTMRHAAALLQSTADHIPDAGKMVAAMPVGEPIDCAYYSSQGACCESGEPCKADKHNDAILAAASSQPVREPLTVDVFYLGRHDDQHARDQRFSGPAFDAWLTVHRLGHGHGLLVWHDCWKRSKE